MDVKIEGKNVQLLGDAMSNNHGGPANAATLMGTMQSPLPPGVPAPGEVDPCNHVWKVLESKPGKTPAQAAADNDSLVARNQGKPSMAGTMRGYAFENKAVDANMAFMNIQVVGREYVCDMCKQMQDVDIVGDKRVAEAKSRNFEGVKKKSKQARRIRDIQQKLFDKNQNPLAKLDGGMTDHKESAGKYLERGFDVEIVP